MCVIKRRANIVFKAFIILKSYNLLTDVFEEILLLTILEFKLGLFIQPEAVHIDKVLSLNQQIEEMYHLEEKHPLKSFLRFHIPDFL